LFDRPAVCREFGLAPAMLSNILPEFVDGAKPDWLELSKDGDGYVCKMCSWNGTGCREFLG
jgi:hypothetical protein